MSSIVIEVVDVTVADKISPKGTKYKAMAVVFRDINNGGKVESKQIFEFGNKDVWKTLEGAARGDTFTVDREKDKKEGKYWDWVAIHRQDGPVATTGGTAVKTPTKPTYETPEERAIKQRYIIRQSCLNVAAQAAAVTGSASPGDIIAYAKEFEAFVLSSTEPEKPTTAKVTQIADLEDDLPY